MWWNALSFRIGGKRTSDGGTEGGIWKGRCDEGLFLYVCCFANMRDMGERTDETELCSELTGIPLRRVVLQVCVLFRCTGKFFECFESVWNWRCL